MIEEMKQLGTGAVILTEWLGSGAKVVPHAQAEQRSKICEKCPLNSHGQWWDTATHKIADFIKASIELKDGMSIAVENEEKLFMCSGCGCALPLKVHVPIEHIRDHTTPEQMAKFAPNCWILKELKQ